jgi:hypothetical protein
MLRTLIILSIAFSLSACRSGSNTASTAPTEGNQNVLAGWNLPDTITQPLPATQEPTKEIAGQPEAQQVVQEPAPTQPLKEPTTADQPLYSAQPESRPEPADPVRYQSVTLEWTIPIQRENGQLLGANELDGFIIEYTQKGQPGVVEQQYVEGGQVASQALELPPGYYSFRVIAVDTQGLTSNPSEWVGITLS